MQEHIKYNFVLWYQSLNKTKINKSNKIQKFNEFKQLKNSNPEICHKPESLIDFNQEHSISITLSQEQPRKYHNHLWCLPKIKHQKIQPSSAVTNIKLRKFNQNPEEKKIPKFTNKARTHKQTQKLGIKPIKKSPEITKDHPPEITICHSVPTKFEA